MPTVHNTHIVLVRIPIVLMRHHDLKASWEERAYLAYISTLLFIPKGSQDRSSYRARVWRQELVERP